MRAPITDKHLLEMMWGRFPEIMQRGTEQAQPVMTRFPMKLTCTKCGAVDEGFLDIESDAPPPSLPLTDEQEYEAIGTAGVHLLELAKQWADNEIHVYQFDNEAHKIIKAVLRRAHGIKGGA